MKGSANSLASHILVTRGLDPRVHLSTKMLDRRVKPGDDKLFTAVNHPLTLTKRDPGSAVVLPG